jgi:histidine ammonia-lyase
VDGVDREMTPQALILDGRNLSIKGVADVARGGRAIVLSPGALERVARARAVLERLLAQGVPVYGVNTGGGSLKRHHVSEQEMDAFNNRVRRFGSFGPELPGDVVRAMLVARINGLLDGAAGVRPELVDALAAVVNAGIVPVVHAVGSVGEGDLGPQFEASGVVRGLGEAHLRGHRVSALEALAAAGLEPIRLREKERQAITNANTLAVGLGALVVYDAMNLLECMDIAGALSLEGFAGNPSIVDPAVERAHPFPGQRAVAAHFRALLAGSYITRPGGPRNLLQDPLSFRCQPQTIGAAYDAVTYAGRQVEIELNSEGINALVDVESERTICNGNFDAIAVGNALDFLRIALCHAVMQANARILKLLNQTFSGLSTGLAPTDSAWGSDLLMIEHASAAATAEIRYLANPATLDNCAPIAEGVEDHASMASFSARVSQQQVQLARRIVADEMLIACQAIELRGVRNALGAGTQAAYRLIRELIPPLAAGVEWQPDIDGLEDAIASGAVIKAVREAGARLEWQDEPPGSRRGLGSRGTEACLNGG